MDFLKNIPKWALIALIVYLAFLITFAIFDGRRVDLWPPVIHEKTISPNGDLVSENAALKRKLTAKKSYLSPQETIELFPEKVRRETVKQTADEVFKLVQIVSEQNDKLAVWEKKIKIIENIEGDFLYRILTFHDEALCFGDSLNFTHEPLCLDAAKCTKKEELAKRFLGFLAEIEFYNRRIVANPTVAKTELIKYQESKSFGRTGWYSRDVFKWIVLDYYGKS